MYRDGLPVCRQITIPALSKYVYRDQRINPDMATFENQKEESLTTEA